METVTAWIFIVTANKSVQGGDIGYTILITYKYFHDIVYKMF